MTGGQTSIAFQMEGDTQQNDAARIQRIVRPATAMKVVYASDEEVKARGASGSGGERAAVACGAVRGGVGVTAFCTKKTHRMSFVEKLCKRFIW